MGGGGGGYEMDTGPPYRPERQNTAQMPAWPDNASSNTLVAQPTVSPFPPPMMMPELREMSQYSVANLPHSYNEAPSLPPSRNALHPPVNPDPYSHVLYPEDIRDEYPSADPYQPHPMASAAGPYRPFDDSHRYDGPYDDHRPMLDTTLSPLSAPGGAEAQDSYFPPTLSPVSHITTTSATPTPTPQPGGAVSGVRRFKTVKRVELFRGNLVLDCPVPKKLLQMLPMANEREFTHMRYSAATCDPADFVAQRFTLRQNLFQKQRATELFIVVTMYNENEVLFARTMAGVFKNVAYLCQRNRSQTWGEEAWKKVVVCIVSDGRGKINPRTRSVLAGMGCYQEGIAKTKVNDADVTAHIYEVFLIPPSPSPSPPRADRVQVYHPGGNRTGQGGHGQAHPRRQ